MSLLILFPAPVAGSNTTGTSAVSALRATALAAGLLVFSGTSAGTAAKATGAASGSQVFSAAGAATATAATDTATSAQSFIATASGTATAGNSVSAGLLKFVGQVAVDAIAATVQGDGTTSVTSLNTSGTSDNLATPATSFARGISTVLSGSEWRIKGQHQRIVSGSGSATAAPATSHATGICKRYHNSGTVKTSAQPATSIAVAAFDYEAQNEAELLLIL